jgi:hypothetical protein
MKNTYLKLTSSMAILILIASCGNDSGSSTKNMSTPGTTQTEEVAPVDGSNIEGHYTAKFITLNPHVNGTIPGSANFYRKEDKIYAYVRLFAGGVKAWHQQHVYTGGRCPTMSDDTNGDGFIDINEAESVMGKILIPLDADISSQDSGRRFFPLGDLSGYYHYERITSFRRFLQDLQEEDKNLEDDVVKLAPGEGLLITGKTVLIQGVAETIELPETIGSKGRNSSYQTLPIACGNFEKVTGTPGETYVQDVIPGPIAEVQEGQDRPAEEDIPSTTGGSTGGTGTGTNDSDDGEGPVSDGEGRTTPENDNDERESETPSSGGTSGGTTTEESRNSGSSSSSTTSTTTRPGPIRTTNEGTLDAGPGA